MFPAGRKVTNQEELKEVYISNNMNEDVKNIIIEYLCPPQNSRTIRIIQKHIEMKLRENYKSHKIRKFVSKEIRYSYKKGSSIPAKYGTKRMQLVKVFHWAELLKLLLDGKSGKQRGWVKLWHIGQKPIHLVAEKEECLHNQSYHPR